MLNKVTEKGIRDQIVKTEYFVVGLKTTICCLTLKNGFEVIGFSSCVDPNNFNKQIGEDIAYENAFNKIWELEGYKLQSELCF
jgi:hypothetical protein